MALLEVSNLSVNFRTSGAVVNAVSDVSFSVNTGETLCIVGESGCGKTVTALSIPGLLPTPPAEIAYGSILFDGRNLLELPKKQLTNIRGRDISMIFQDPMTSLNPVFTCGFQIVEALMAHRDISRSEAVIQAVKMLRLVHIPDPEKRVHEYPHQLSGGMRQRVMIAMALSCRPKLLIADEPTTALDVTIQAQILELLAELKENRDMAMIFITHDLGIVAEIADRVMVLYAGRVVERGNVFDIYNNPKHPYTIGLLASVPKMKKGVKKLIIIPGSLPDASNLPPGCRFYERCSRKTVECLCKPDEIEVSPGHYSACFNMD